MGIALGLSYAVFLQNTPLLSDAVPRAMPGLVCDAPSAPLTDGVGSVLDREVYFASERYVLAMAWRELQTAIPR